MIPPDGNGRIFQPPKPAVLLYERQLRGVAKECAKLIGRVRGEAGVPHVQASLVKYAAALEPWARDRAGKMLARVAEANFRMMAAMAQEGVKVAELVPHPVQTAPVPTPPLPRAAAARDGGILSRVFTRLRHHGDRIMGTVPAGRVVDEARETKEQKFKAMMRHSVKISRGLLEEMRSGSAVSRVFHTRTEANVALIKDIPTKAADWIGQAVVQSHTRGDRAGYLAARVREIQDMTETRALLIARTEISKASTEFTKARAESVGSKGYIWRTAGDGVVRDSHADMEGEFVAWDKPPELDGMTGHAGEFPNCRCYPEVVL